MGKFVDLTGKRFGRLTVIDHIHGTKQRKGRWICKCDCGNIHTVETGNLTRGMVKSCGACPRRKYDYAQKRFGKLLVLSPAIDKAGHRGWKCLCDCGNETFVESGRLTSALKHPNNPKYTVNSCGCVRGTRTTHGGSRTRLYSVWLHMKQRCYDKNCEVFRHYGGRGIEVCAEWKDDFAAFREWALANGYDESKRWSECTIDRIDVNGNYEPGNCRWVDMHTQLLNRRAARLG